METEQVQKVAELSENPMENEEQVKNVGGGDKRDENEICYMDELPNEILMKILDYLDEQQLVNCRLLSAQWNEISCLLLQDKSKNNPQSKFVVQLRRAHGMAYLRCNTVVTQTRSIDEFLDCFSPSGAENSSDVSRPFPFSRLDVQHFSYFKEDQILQFISVFGSHLKSLTLDVTQEDCDNFQNFWKLLLDFAPNIQHLGITGGEWLNNLNLFDSDSVNSKVENQENGASFLQNLKSVKVARDNGFDEFLKNLLNNTPNVKEVMSSYFPFNNVQGLENFSLWQRIEKSHLIKHFEMAFFDASQNYLPPADLMKNVRLDYLKADCNSFSVSVENAVYSMYSVPKEKGISYVTHAIKSSQDSLSSLELDNLTTENMNSCFKDISSLPNVQKLQIEIVGDLFKTVIASHEMRRGITEEEVVNLLTRFSQICPNITHLIIDVLRGDFLRIAPILWTQFKGLKFLKLSLIMNGDAVNNVLSLTSGFSGYSKDSLEIIEEKLDQGISLDEARRDEPQKPSIFDLKDLSRLEIVFLFSERSHEFEYEKELVEKSLLVKILPQHICENPRTFDYHDNHTDDNWDVTHSSVSEADYGPRDYYEHDGYGREYESDADHWSGCGCYECNSI